MSDRRQKAFATVALVLVAAVLVVQVEHPPVPTPETVTAPPPPQASTTAQKVLRLAASQVGTVEGRGGGTRYHREYGLAPNQPWCAVFVWVMFRDADASPLIGPKTAYTPTMAAWFRARGQWSDTPAVGALVFYNWPGDGIDRIQHVGLVESFTADRITTIEGNTDAGARDDGDGVWRRTRARNSAIVGYGLPAYSRGVKG